MVWFSIILKIVLPALLVLLNLHQFLYNKKPKYYFWFVKTFKKWRDTKWQINANYSISEVDESFDVIENAIRNTFGDFDRVVNLKNKKQYIFNDFSLLVQSIDFELENRPKIELKFLPINVTYRVAKEKLFDLRSFFTEVDEKINCHDKNFHMNINFNNSNNPFFGLMIQRLGKENLTYFECLFDVNTLKKTHSQNVNTKKKNNIRVFKDQITINEKSFATIEAIALDILLMR